MRSALRHFLTWLDKRFPEKVVITQASFEALQKELDHIRNMEIDKRMRHIEAEINKFNINMGFGGKIDPRMANVQTAFNR